MAGIFSLQEVRTEQFKNYQYAGLESSSTVTETLYAYFAGGETAATPTNSVTVDRFDFSTGNRVSIASLSQARSDVVSAQTSSYGYFGGGILPTAAVVCTIDRLDFASETIAAPLQYRISQARQAAGGVSSSSYGYFAGGVSPGNIRVSTIDRLDFSTETLSTPPAKLTTTRNSVTPFYSDTYGYFCGGISGPAPTPVRVSIINRLEFSTETVTTPTPKLSAIKSGGAGAQSSTFGYFAGGFAAARVSTIERLSFSTETVSATTNLSAAKNQQAGSSGDTDAFIGGGINPTPAYISTIERLDFTTHTGTASPIGLSQARASAGGVLYKKTSTINVAKQAIDLDINNRPGYGYFAGGSRSPVFFSTISRIDFSTETVTTPTPKLSQARDELTAVLSSSYGYFGGGVAPGVAVCTIDRLDFSTETVTVPTPKLSQARSELAAVSSSSYGYFGGGTAPAIPGRVCTIDRIDFSTETVSVPTPQLSQAKEGLTAVSSIGYGYFGGGDVPSSPLPFRTTTIDRIDFSTETVSVPTPKLSQARRNLAATSSSSYGYFGGGYTTPGGIPPEPNWVCTINRLDFSTETTSTPTPKLSQARHSLAATSSSSYGYFAGGFGPTSTTDRIDFSSETVSRATPGTLLSQDRNSYAAVSGGSKRGVEFALKYDYWPESPKFGYFGGGYIPPATYSSTIDRIDFSTETVTSQAPKLSSPKDDLATVSNTSYSYFGGGYISPTVRVSTIDRVDFSTETVSSPSSKLSIDKATFSAVSSPSYGYFVGGVDPTSPTFSTHMDRLDFSTETVSVPKSLSPSTSSGGKNAAAVQTSSYGYFAGGTDSPVPTSNSTIFRIDFTTETAEEPGLVLPVATKDLASVQNSLYGYFAGGGIPPVPTPVRVCTISRLDFSTLTLSLQSNGLSAQTSDLAATSSSSYGYFGGGLIPTPAVVSTIDRLDFSTETVSTPAPKLTQARSNLAATSGVIKNLRVGSATYGYFGGGFSTCTIDRLDFSTETISTPTPKLSQARRNLAATSSSSYGYFGGGAAPGPTNVCTIDRLDFSTETVSVPTPQLSQARRNLAATSSSSYGYFGGGYIPSTPTPISFCTIDRLDFSTETVSVPTPKLSQAKNGSATVSSSFYGYFGGGVIPTPAAVCTIDRLDFSTETVSVPTPKLSQAKGRLAATSSSSYGYFGGGLIPPSSQYCTIDRLDFSTETVSVPTPKLSEAKEGLAATSSSSYGYFGGGTLPPTTSTIDRLDFSTEITSVPTVKLPISRDGLAAVSNAN